MERAAAVREAAARRSPGKGSNLEFDDRHPTFIHTSPSGNRDQWLDHTAL